MKIDLGKYSYDNAVIIPITRDDNAMTNYYVWHGGSGIGVKSHPEERDYNYITMGAWDKAKVCLTPELYVKFTCMANVLYEQIERIEDELSGDFLNDDNRAALERQKNTLEMSLAIIEKERDVMINPNKRNEVVQ